MIKELLLVCDIIWIYDVLKNILIDDNWCKIETENMITIRIEIMVTTGICLWTIRN